MMQCLVPSCYFPSTVVFIDDNQDFLVNFTLQLLDDLAYHIYDSPYTALEAIEDQQRKSEKLDKRCISEYLDADTWPFTNHTVNINLSTIHSEIYNPQRFHEITVVVVDYAMPGMNGLEFCKHLNNTAIKKILLTGQADEKVAIAAFNEGIIDKFVQKSDPNVTQVVNEAITQLQQSYFLEMSAMINKMIAVNAPSCLQDPKFAAFFKELRLQNNITEFYLTDNSGSFLLLNANGDVKCLIVKNDHDLKLLAEFARDNKVPAEILRQLETGEKIPFFWQSVTYHIEWTDWQTSLVPAQKIECQQPYYYALINDPVDISQSENKIVPYHSFLDSMDVDHLAVANS